MITEQKNNYKIGGNNCNLQSIERLTLIFNIMEQPIIIPDEIVISKIYFVRNQKVMIDSDLAELYSVETKRLIEQVNRNIYRFPEDFMFQLTEN